MHRFDKNVFLNSLVFALIRIVLCGEYLFFYKARLANRRLLNFLIIYKTTFSFLN